MKPLNSATLADDRGGISIEYLMLVTLIAIPFLMATPLALQAGVIDGYRVLDLMWLPFP